MIERLPRWAFALVVVGACVVTAVGMGAYFSSCGIGSHGEQKLLTCMNNQSQLAQAYLLATQGRPDASPRSGPALWLGFYGTQIKSGGEAVFVCPGDPSANVPETEADRSQYEHVDLARVPRALCSFAGRDFERFPIVLTKAATEPIGACVHHKGVAIVVFADGAVQKMTLVELGLASDDEKIVGPESKSPVLRVLRYGDGSVR